MVTVSIFDQIKNANGSDCCGLKMNVSIMVMVSIFDQIKKNATVRIVAGVKFSERRKTHRFEKYDSITFWFRLFCYAPSYLRKLV